MVWFWNGWDLCYRHVLNLNIQKQNQYIKLQDCIHKSSNYSKTEPSTNQTAWTIQNPNMFGI